MHPPSTDTEVPSTPFPFADEPAWQQLPGRGAWLAATGGALTMGIVLGMAGFAFSLLLDRTQLLPAVLAAGGTGAVFGAWFGFRRHRRTFWHLDEHGLGLRRGHWWHSETRVPLSRVQHLDLRRGPLERVAGLGTLVVHTAGSRHSAVSIAGLDQHDAEHLRDRLSRQLDEDDAL